MEYLTLVLLNCIQALQVLKRTRLQKYTDTGKYQLYHAVIVNAAMRRKKYKSDRFLTSPFIYFHFFVFVFCSASGSICKSLVIPFVTMSPQNLYLIMSDPVYIPTCILPILR